MKIIDNPKIKLPILYLLYLLKPCTIISLYILFNITLTK